MLQNKHARPAALGMLLFLTVLAGAPCETLSGGLKKDMGTSETQSRNFYLNTLKELPALIEKAEVLWKKANQSSDDMYAFQAAFDAAMGGPPGRRDNPAPFGGVAYLEEGWQELYEANLITKAEAEAGFNLCKRLRLASSQKAWIEKNMKFPF